MLYVLIFQGKNSDKNAPQCYFILTFPLLLIMTFQAIPFSLPSYYELHAVCLDVLGTQLKYVGVTYIYLICCSCFKPMKYVWPNNHATLAKRELALVTLQNTIFCPLNDN